MRIMGAVVRTPTLHSKTLSDLTGANVYLKFENLQFTAAYKERGALNTLLQLDDDARAKGVIAASAGNHAQGLAYHGNRLGIPVTIVMPKSTPTVKVTQTESHGATIILEGETFDEAYAHARKLEASNGYTFVHPFDDPRIIAGQGTVFLEMLADAPAIDTLIVPIGGGGLISGALTVAKAADKPIEVVGVQAELFPSMFNRITGAHEPIGGDTLAEGIAVKEPGGLTAQIVEALVDQPGDAQPGQPGMPGQAGGRHGVGVQPRGEQVDERRHHRRQIPFDLGPDRDPRLSPSARSADADPAWRHLRPARPDPH